jgi:hypothetical protein
MPFMPGDTRAPVPVLVRLARNLLLVQACLVLFPLILVVVVSATLGSNTTASESTALSPGVQRALLALGVVAFAAAAYWVGRLHPMARWGSIGVEVVWVLSIVVPGAAANPVGNILYFLLAVAVVVLLLLPDNAAAFRTGGNAAGETKVATADPDSSGPVSSEPSLPRDGAPVRSP